MKLLKIIGILVFATVGSILGNIVFDSFVDPLNIGPRPLVAALTVLVFVAVFFVLGTVILKAQDLK